MEKEVVELFEVAKKAADAAAKEGDSPSGPEVERCVDALKQLMNVTVTSAILVSTQVGKRLRPLTKHPGEKIRSIASELLEKWKKVVVEETTKKKNGTVDNRSSTKAEAVKAESVKVEKVEKGSTAKALQTSTSDPIKAEKVDRNKPPKDEMIFKEDRQTSNGKKPLKAAPATPKLATLIKCNDALRDKYREILAEALSKVSSEASEDIQDEVNACDPYRVAVSVESVMFEKLGRSNGPQKFKYRSIMFNMKDEKNPDFRRKVLLGRVKPEVLITMTADEMASDERQNKNKEIKVKALFECSRGNGPQATTDEFKCGRCGQRKCTYYQMQTRSADEPMTTYVTCTNCNKRWKFC